MKVNALSLSLVLWLVGCASGIEPDTHTDPDPGDVLTVAPDLYAFPSRVAGMDSVSYSGQTFRQVLIADLKAHLGALTGRIDTGFFPAPGDVAAELTFYYEFDSSTSGAVPLGVSTTPPPLQSVYDDVSSDKDLAGKIAGADPVGQHRDWAAGLDGWEDPGATSPDALVRAWFDEVDAAAVARVGGVIPLDPDGVPVSAVTLTDDGVDYQQLLEKFLRGAVALSQGADDYLDDDEPGKGLLSDHGAVEEDKSYTALEHAWDEGFGYFGAARTFAGWTDDEIADPGYVDVDQDGAIDLGTEVSWGHSRNAGKRDVGSSAAAPTDLTTQAWTAFHAGRALLAETTTDLTPDELDELRGYRDQAVDAWEQAIAATVVHYINEVLQDMEAAGTSDYDYADHAKHWSELKGFALSFQFNPHSPLSDAQRAQLYAGIGDRPVLPSATPAEQQAYAQALREARTLLGSVHDFDPSNMGDDDGQNGW